VTLELLNVGREERILPRLASSEDFYYIDIDEDKDEQDSWMI
jgi:hypothetical protein